VTLAKEIFSHLSSTTK